MNIWNNKSSGSTSPLSIPPSVKLAYRIHPWDVNVYLHTNHTFKDLKLHCRSLNQNVPLIRVWYTSKQVLLKYYLYTFCIFSVPMQYSNWYTIQPPPAEDCTILEHIDRYTWKSQNCNSKIHGYICEINEHTIGKRV